MHAVSCHTFSPLFAPRVLIPHSLDVRSAPTSPLLRSQKSVGDENISELSLEVSSRLRRHASRSKGRSPSPLTEEVQGLKSNRLSRDSSSASWIGESGSSKLILDGDDKSDSKPSSSSTSLQSRRTRSQSQTQANPIKEEDEEYVLPLEEGSISFIEGRRPGSVKGERKRRQSSYSDVKDAASTSKNASGSNLHKTRRY